MDNPWTIHGLSMDFFYIYDMSVIHLQMYDIWNFHCHKSIHLRQLADIYAQKKALGMYDTCHTSKLYMYDTCHTSKLYV